MVVKRIISLLAMFGVVFLISCYDVQLDKESVITNENWADGLEPELIIERMPVTVEPVLTVTKAESDTTTCEVEVTWECPIDTDQWAVEVSDDGVDYEALDVVMDGESKGVTGTETVTIIKTPCYTVDAVVYYTYSFKCNWAIVNDVNYIGYFKILMPSANPGEFFSTITSFVVFPDGRTLRVTVNSSDADARSDIYYNLADNALFTNVNKNNVPASSVESSLGSYRLAYFSILTNLSDIGRSGKVRHYSNSSYCRVTKIATSTYNPGPGRTIEATLKYEFEDLPCNLKGYEPGQKFDYNDVIITVDIIK